MDAAIPYIIDLLKTLADQANMHFMLLASSWGSCNIPIIMWVNFYYCNVRELSTDMGRLDSQEFTWKNVEQMVFLSAKDGLGARVRTDYITYTVN